MFLLHRLPSHMIGTLSLLVALSSPLVAADLLPRTNGVCESCPAISGRTLTSSSETSNSINCAYTGSATCKYSPSNGALMVTGSTVSKCPNYCCSDDFTFYAGSGGCVRKVTCDAGKYRDDSNACVSCPSGQTSNPGATCANDCFCAAGSYRRGNSCSSCAAGTFSGPGASSCTPCAANTISTPGASTCTSCPPGSTSRAGSATCTPVSCPRGSFIDGNSCSTCPEGTYSGRDSNTCSQCPANTFSAAGASSCTACPTGHTCRAGSTHISQCTAPCVAGNYLQNGQCTPCDAGTFSSGPNAASCTDCPANTFSGRGAGTCTNCPTGHTCPSRSTASSQCTAPSCPAGSYLHNRQCTSCSSGTFSSSPDSTSCTPCPANTISGPGATSCSDCPASTKSRAGSSTCSPVSCPAGSFINGHECSSCPAGTYSGRDFASCTDCPANSFSSGGTATCTHCPTGYTSFPGSTSASSCTATCPAGKYVNNGQCTPCAAGTYSSSPNSATCSQCPANTFSSGGAGSCTPCPTGHTCGRGSTHSSQCTPPACPAGRYVKNGQCVACPAGTFSANPGSTSCDECPEDTYSDAGASHCLNCPRGFGCGRRKGPGQCQPKGCPPGFHYGADRHCYECPRNTYGPGGYAGCTSCPPNQHSRRGSDHCTPNNTPSNVPRAPQKVISCPRHHMLCPIAAGVAQLECVDVQTSLESCGGCVGLEADGTGQDCSAIANVSDVSCVHGACLVTKCIGDFEVSTGGDSCVETHKKKRSSHADGHARRLSH